MHVYVDTQHGQRQITKMITSVWLDPKKLDMQTSNAQIYCISDKDLVSTNRTVGSDLHIPVYAHTQTTPRKIG
jgi:hypothetical protein